MSPEESHQHSLQTLTYLAKLEDYLSNINNIADMGAGYGYDAAWLANLISPEGRRFNFNVTAVEQNPVFEKLKTVKGMKWVFEDFNTVELPEQDIILCHNSFQYVLNPIATLQHWHKLLRVDGLLLIEIPYKLKINNHRDKSKVDAEYDAGAYHIYTLGNLILMLASVGFDCRNAHFHLDREGGWIRAGVYKTANEPKYYGSWHDLKDSGLLPQCLDAVIHSKNSFSDTDLVVEWIDRSVTILAV